MRTGCLVSAFFFSTLLFSFQEASRLNQKPVQMSIPTPIEAREPATGPRFEQLKPGPAPSGKTAQKATITLYYDGFEGSFPGDWLLIDNNGTTSGEVTWGATSFTSSAGSRSAFCAGGGANGILPGNEYPVDMQSWMILGPFDLTAVSAARLIFDLNNRSEEDYDFISFMASTDGTSFNGFQLSGDSGGWNTVSFDLASLPGGATAVGFPDVYVAFLFSSDLSFGDLGAFVDEVYLEVETIGGEADLSLDEIDVENRAYEPDEVIAIENLVTNIGSSLSDPYRIVFAASRDAAISGDDIPIGYIDRDPLGVGESHSYVSNGTLPDLDAGTWYIGAVLDIEDADIGNNVAIDPVPITVTSPCSLPGTPEPTGPADGETIFGASATLSWQAVADTDSYEVYAGESQNPPLYQTTSQTSISIPIEAGQRLYWRVRAVNECGSSGYSELRDVSGSTAYSYLIPHLPPTNNGWEVDIHLFNPTDQPKELTMDIYERHDGGYQLTGSQQMTLAPGDVEILESLATAEADQRWIGIRGNGIGGSYSFASDVGSGKQRTALPIYQLSDEHDQIVFPHIPANRESFFSGFAIVNPHPTTNRIRFELWGDQGNIVNERLLPAYANGLDLGPAEKWLGLFEGNIFDDTQSTEKVSSVVVKADFPIVGFELFGIQADLTNGELAGIEASPPKGRNEDHIQPLNVMETAYSGLSVLNTSAETATVTLSVYDVYGELMGQITDSYGPRVKKLGLLSEAGFTYPFGNNNPLLTLAPEEAPRVGSVHVRSNRDIAVFNLTGESGETFDGTVPQQLSPARALVIPRREGDHLLQIYCGSDGNDSAAVRVFDENGEKILASQVSIQPNGWGFIEIPGSTESPRYVEVAGGSPESRLAAFFTENGVEGGKSLTITPGFACITLPSRTMINGDVLLPPERDLSDITVVSVDDESPLGFNKRATAFQISAGIEASQLLACVGPDDEVFALGIPMTVLSPATPLTSYDLNMQSTAVALTLAAPILGTFRSPDIVKRIHDEIIGLGAVQSLEAYLEERRSMGLEPVDLDDPTLLDRIRASQRVSIDHITDILITEMRAGLPPDQRGKAAFGSLVEGPGSGRDGLIFRVGELEDDSTTVTITNYYLRHVALYQKLNTSSAAALNGSDYVGIIEPAPAPLTWSGLLNLIRLELLQRDTSHDVDLPPSNQSAVNNLFALGLGGENTGTFGGWFPKDDLHLFWPALWRDTFYHIIGPIVTMATGGTDVASLVDLLADQFPEFIDSLFLDIQALDWQADYTALAEDIYNIALDKLNADNGYWTKRITRALQNKSNRGPDGLWDRITKKLVGGLAKINLIANYANAGWTLAGYLVTLPDLSQVSEYDLTVQYTPPVILDFSADPEMIGQDESSTLTWQVLDAYEVRISGIEGSFPISGATTVSPSQTTQYTLTATGLGGSTQAVLTITVDTGPRGTISGRVLDAVTDAPISGVSVRVVATNSRFNPVYTNTDENGELSIEVPADRDYQVDFTKDGYLPVTYENVEVIADTTTFLATVLQLDTIYSGDGTVTGNVINALDGSGVSGLTLRARAGINVTSGPVVRSTTTASGGSYTLSNLPGGNYTVEASGDGFNTGYFNIVCIGDQTTPNQNGTVTPILTDTETRIILRWGEAPWDLDSHLTGPRSFGGRFHVFYGDSFYEDSQTRADLDLDDTSSYGPETITIYRQASGVYRYSVHDYTNSNSSSSTELSRSDAQVEVYQGNTRIAVFNVPANRGGTLWTVFELEGTQLTPINTMTHESSPGSVTKSSETDGYLIRSLPEKD